MELAGGAKTRPSYEARRAVQKRYPLYVAGDGNPEAFRATSRFRVFAPWEHVDGTPRVMGYARDHGLGFNDMMENVLGDGWFRLDERGVYFFPSIHQESTVVPENIDAIRASRALEADGRASIAKTDPALGLGRL